MRALRLRSLCSSAADPAPHQRLEPVGQVQAFAQQIFEQLLLAGVADLAFIVHARGGVAKSRAARAGSASSR